MICVKHKINFSTTECYLNKISSKTAHRCTCSRRSPSSPVWIPSSFQVERTNSCCTSVEWRIKDQRSKNFTVLRLYSIHHTNLQYRLVRNIQWLCTTVSCSTVPSWADGIAPDNRRNRASRSSSVFHRTAPRTLGGTRLKICPLKYWD